MWRRTANVLQRTSRQGPGGWSQPTLVQRVPGRPETPHHATNRDGRNPTHSRGQGATLEEADPHENNWRADPRMVPTPPRAVAQGYISMPPLGGSRRSLRATQHDRFGAEGPSNEPAGCSASWTGSPSVNTDAFDTEVGVSRPSMVGEAAPKLTLTQLLLSLASETVDPPTPGSLKGDPQGMEATDSGSMQAAASGPQHLKSMNPHITPFLHSPLLDDYLKNIKQLHAPSGRLCPREVLKGRLVGLLFFSESARCKSFLQKLSAFHRTRSPDFVVVCISVGGKEMMDLTRPLGFLHCSHRDGASYVQRDVGVTITSVTPLPRLVIVDGTTGFEVTRFGVQGVVVRPDTCMDAWRRGDSGMGPWDWLRTLYI